MIKCRECKLKKSLENFYKYPKGQHGVEYICKECKRFLRRERYRNYSKEGELAYSRLWAKNNLDKCRDIHRVAKRKKRHGVSREEFLIQSQIQDNKCAHCNKEESLEYMVNGRLIKRGLSIKTMNNILALICFACEIDFRRQAIRSAQIDYLKYLKGDLK